MRCNTERRAKSRNQQNEQFPRPEMRRDERDRLIIHIPVALKKRVGRKEIVLPPGHRLEDHRGEPSINKPLAIAIALGHRWLDLLAEGQYSSVGELAEAVGMDPSQLRRHMSLTCISPRLVRAVMAGKEPSGASVEKWKEAPASWAEQV